jgi:hypothetical protein
LVASREACEKISSAALKTEIFQEKFAAEKIHFERIS